MNSFIGNIDARTDSKGRAFIPAVFRRIAGEDATYVLRRSLFQPCLVLYTSSEWERLVAELRAKLSPWNRSQSQLFRQFVAEADHIEPEDNGRMLIPKRHIEQLQLKSDIRFVGCDNCIEIWPAGAVENTFVSDEDLASSLEKAMEASTALH